MEETPGCPHAGLRGLGTALVVTNELMEGPWSGGGSPAHREGEGVCGEHQLGIQTSAPLHQPPWPGRVCGPPAATLRALLRVRWGLLPAQLGPGSRASDARGQQAYAGQATQRGKHGRTGLAPRSVAPEAALSGTVGGVLLTAPRHGCSNPEAQVASGRQGVPRPCPQPPASGGPVAGPAAAHPAALTVAPDLRALPAYLPALVLRPAGSLPDPALTPVPSPPLCPAPAWPP